MDMANLLAELTAVTETPKKVASEAEIRAVAMRMAKNGYRFTAETLALVKPYIEGTGLMLKGDVGIGKSFFFYTLGVPAINLKVAQGRTLEEITRALDSWVDTPILIDDIGAEDLNYKSFGNSVRLLDYIIEKRSDAPVATHVTTNLTPDQLLERYGERTVDRLTGMAEYHELGGESKRDPSNARRQDTWFNDFFKGRIWKDCARCCAYYDADERRCTKGKTTEPQAYGERIRCPYF